MATGSFFGAVLRRVAGRPRAQSRIVLHIGRNRAGSGTVRDFCLASRGELRARGVDYVTFGEADGAALTPVCHTFEELSAYAQSRPNRQVLVSSALMLAWPRVFIEAAARALAGADVKVLAYIRPYDTWAVSSYADDTVRGVNTRDIDAYVDWLWPRVSVWPQLQAWGECFGWERLRLRALGPKSLQGGGLTSDLMHGLGLAPISHRAQPSNASPHWLEVEMVRRLAENSDIEEWTGSGRAAVVEPLLGELRPLICGAPSAAYLSLSQRRHLTNLYNEDLARVIAAGGPTLPEAKPPAGSERPFLPSVGHAPSEVLRSFFARTLTATFAQAYPDAARRALTLKAEWETASSRRVA